jgi:hypothetical protein
MRTGKISGCIVLTAEPCEAAGRRLIYIEFRSILRE